LNWLSPKQVVDVEVENSQLLGYVNNSTELAKHERNGEI
jgi:hypothetical protein